MSASKSASDWTSAAEWVTRAGEDRGVHQLYPDPTAKLSLIDASGSPLLPVSIAEKERGRQLQQRLTAITAQLSTMNVVGNCPIVGVAGLLNSGKSSLIATYLSELGRHRVLRGTANDQGTHRFVLWLPSLWWSQPELLAAVRAHLTTLFGVAPEELSPNRDTAFRQYNGEIVNAAWLGTIHDDGAASASIPPIDPLSVPLLAHDTGLDSLGLGLLDCPDIQTAFWQSTFNTPDAVASSRSIDESDAEQLQQLRREHLGKVGRLCSAFVVVSKFGSLGEQRLLDILDTLRDTMPGVPRILAVNKVKARYAPDVVLTEARPIVDRFEIESVYLAYDFRSHWAADRLPPAPAKMAIDQQDPLPIFFLPAAETASMVAGSAVATSASDVAGGTRRATAARYLHNLGDLLRPGTLVVESRRSVISQLESKTSETLSWFESCRSSRQQQLRHAWQAIADACFEFMAERDSVDRAIALRLQTSPAIIGQMSDSLCRSAPWSMKLSLAIDRSVRSLQHTIADNAKRLTWLRSAAGGVSQFVNRFRQGETGQVVNAERFLEQINRCDRYGAFESSEQAQLSSACERALERFKAEDTVRLDSQWLDTWAAETWKHMPMKRKLYVGAVPLAPIFGPLLAVTLIPFDGGGTSVLVFATLKELLAAAGIAAVATPMLGGHQATEIVEREAAWSQLSELFAVTCDSIGLPRPSAPEMPRVNLSGENRQLPESQLPPKGSEEQTAVTLWRLAPNFPQHLSNQFASMRRELETVSHR